MWKTPVAKNDSGEVGKVYYLNLLLISKDEPDRTKPQPFTLNPTRGKDIEHMLKMSEEIPNVIKDQLMKNRKAEVRLTNGATMKLFFSETPAPDTWLDKYKPMIKEQKTESGIIY